ncbi:hypothetical protein N786_17615 [Bacillus amyloliquefaciens UASWS BA1]|nr:hypothetical protein N786_17615 [Bacillus amyloliquefaciens UASWS BA1]
MYFLLFSTIKKERKNEKDAPFPKARLCFNTAYRQRREHPVLYS